MSIRVLVGLLVIATPFAFYQSCRVEDPKTAASVSSDLLSDALSGDFRNRYLGWMHSLPNASSENALAGGKLEVTSETYSSLLRILEQNLGALEGDLEIPSEASNDEKEAFSYTQSALKAYAENAIDESLYSNSTIEGLLLQSPGEIAQSVLEYLASVPVESDEGHRELRARLIMLLGQSKLSNEFTIQSLNLMARGVALSMKDRQYASYETNLANRSVRFIIDRRKENYIAPFQARGYRFASEVDETVEKLKNAKIEKIKALSANKGINESLIVTFRYEDGQTSKFLYKPATGTDPFTIYYYDDAPNDFLNFINFTRESRAANFQHLVLDPLTKIDPQFGRIFTPLTLEVALYHNGHSYGLGSLQKFVDPSYTDIMESQRTETDKWHRSIFGSRAWQEASVVVKTLDFLFGNNDRMLVPGVKDDYDKNMMVQFKDDGTTLKGVALIDNGIGIPGRDWYTIDKLVSPSDMPLALKEALRAAEPQLDAMLAKEVHYFVPWGLQDFRKRYYQVLDRIGRN